MVNMKLIIKAVNWRFIGGFFIFMTFSMMSAKFRPWLDVPIEEPLWQYFSLVLLAFSFIGLWFMRYSFIKPEYQVKLNDVIEQEKEQ